jgi:hypothetical protein
VVVKPLDLYEHWLAIIWLFVNSWGSDLHVLCWPEFVINISVPFLLVQKKNILLEKFEIAIEI